MRLAKNILRKIIPYSLLRYYRNFKSFNGRIETLERDIKNKWLDDKINPKNQKEIFKLKEFKVYSQNGEDGIINYIFSKIKPKNKVFVEFGVENGRECNTANLSLNFNWKGLLIEGNKSDASKAREFYREKPVKIINAFVTKENINKILQENEINEEIDLLSIDIDGNDYWVWKEINAIKPRVVIIEYNSSFGLKPLAIKYKKDFERLKEHKSGLYYGASLTALTKLGKEKGYILAGCCSAGVNAFFIRKDLAKNMFKEMTPEEAFYQQIGRLKLGNIEKQFEKIKHLEFVKIQ